MKNSQNFNPQLSQTASMFVITSVRDACAAAVRAGLQKAEVNKWKNQQPACSLRFEFKKHVW